jgi:hypothetical protein
VETAEPERNNTEATAKTVAKVSNSWAALASTSTPAKKAASIAPKGPTAVAVATPKDGAQKPNIITQARPLTLLVDGWGALPPDVITHHLFDKLDGNAASIKVLRRVCRSWAAALPFPLVDVTKFSAPMDVLPLALCRSKEVRSRGSHVDILTTALGSLKRSVILEVLDLVIPCTPEPAAMRLLAEVIKTCPNLAGLNVYLWGSSSPAMDVVLNALRWRPSLRRVFISDVQNVTLFLQSINLLQLEDLRITRTHFKPEDAEQLQQYLIKTSTLKKLSLQSNYGKTFDIVIEGVKRNRSIKEFSIANCGSHNSAASERVLWDAVSMHPTIERLECMEYWSLCNQIEIAEFLVGSINLKRVQYPARGTRVWNRDAELVHIWNAALEAGKNFGDCDVAQLLPVNHPSIVDKLKLHPSFKSLRIDITNLQYDNYGREQHYKFAGDVLDGNRNIEAVNLSLITGPTENIVSFAKRLSRTKAVKRFETHFAFDDYTKANTKAVAAGLSKLPTLEEIRIGGPFCDESALVLAQGIGKHKRLRVLEIPSSQITLQGATALVEAAAHAGTVTFLDLSNAKIENTDAAFNSALEKCLTRCPLEFLSLRNARMDPSTINVIINTLRGLDACFLKDLDLAQVNMSQLIRQKLDSFILERAGLITLDLNPINRDQRDRAYGYVATLS